MVNQEQVTANLDAELESLSRRLARAVDKYNLPEVKRLSELRDEVLDNRLALHGFRVRVSV